jgi:hypothetical protein
MIDPYSGYGLQKQSIEAMQHQGAQCKADKHGEGYIFEGFAVHGSALQYWQIANQAVRPMKLHLVFASKAAAVCWALQVFGEVKHHTRSGMTTGDDALVSAVDVIVVPYDDGELFSLHGASFSWCLRPVWF